MTSIDHTAMKKPPLLLAGICLAALVSFAATGLREIQFKIMSQQFEAGDSIVVEQVLATSPELKIGDTVLVRGRYSLQSRPQASLGFFLTTKEPSDPTPVSPKQKKGIAAGTGTFELEHVVSADGFLHVSFYDRPSGLSFGEVYFGPATP
jgi:hypothetical protein